MNHTEIASTKRTGEKVGWIGGWLVIGEPSKPILVVETMMALGIIVLGIDRWLAHRRAKRKAVTFLGERCYTPDK